MTAPAPHFTTPPGASYRAGADLQLRVAARDGWACVYCGAGGVPLQVDHVRPCAHFPAAAGRAQVNAPANLVTACEACNGAKGPQDLEGFARMLRGRGVPGDAVRAMLARVRAAVRRPLPSASP